MKFVLVAMADNADASGQAWPCTETICCKTAMDRKTVIAAIDRLEKEGFIQDTGERKGRTGQVKIYQLACGPDLKSPKNGTVPDFPSKAPVFPIKDSQKRETEPLLNPQGTGSVRALEDQGGGTGGTIAAKQQFNATLAVTQLQYELNDLYHRPAVLRVDYAEQSMASAIVARSSWKAELIEIMEYRDRLPAKERRFFPQSVCSLLSRWQEVLDRARVYEPNPQETSREMREAMALGRKILGS